VHGARQSSGSSSLTSHPGDAARPGRSPCCRIQGRAAPRPSCADMAPS
jgi:hypothetical protein